MLARRCAARLAATQALYLMDFASQPREATMKDFLQKKMPHENDIPVVADFDEELFSRILHGAHERQDDIRQLLAGSLDAKWPIERLERILKAVLVAGSAELLENTAVDSAIIINDYVNVAHEFFAGNEPSMVNAVLDKIAKSLRS